MENNFISFACDILGKTAGGLTGSEIAKFFVEYSMKFNRSIKFSDPKFSNEGSLISKRDALKINLNCFKDNEKYYIINDLCSKPKFAFNEDVKKLHVKLIKDYSELNDILSENEKLDYEIINQTKHWLEDYPKALKLYNQAIENFKIKAFERNILDDLRLSLELLLKDIFGNEKSFENQFANIGTLITKSGGSKEFTNMFIKLVEYYSQYQNTYVKHNDKIVASEVEFIIEITSLFMKHIIKVKKANP
jgi:hypothetical protein